MNLPASDYYPALGEKEIWIKVKDGVYQEEMGRIIRDGRNISTAFKDSNGNSVKIGIINDDVDKAKPGGCAITGADAAEPNKSPIEMDTEAQKAHAKFILKCENLNETEKLTGKITVLFERGLLRGEGTGGDPEKLQGKATFTIRSNANVLFYEVRDGKAVYTYDVNTPSNFYGVNRNDDGNGYIFVQELFNQVIPRKRTLTLANNITADQLLIDEGGYFGGADSTRLEIFRNSFNLGIDTNVAFTNTNGNVSYDEGADNTSPTFRKLMKDYGKADTGRGMEILQEQCR